MKVVLSPIYYLHLYILYFEWNSLKFVPKGPIDN